VGGQVRALKSNAVGDILDRQADLLHPAVRPIDGARVEHHDVAADGREKPLDFKGLDCLLTRGDALERGSELGDVPLAIAQREEWPALSVLRPGTKRDPCRTW
jgi:hypothetical protein